MPNLEELSGLVVDAGLKIHRDLGPGMLESVYEVILAEKLIRSGLIVDRQVSINIAYDDIEIANAFKVDLLVAGKLVVEVKSIPQLAPVHAKQLLTYLRLMNQPLGLLLNFGGATFKEGIRRLVNKHTDFASSRLRANQNQT